MLDLFFQGKAVWFSAPALLGTAFFALRLVLMAFGGLGVELGDADGGHDAGPGHHHGDSLDSFRFITLQGVIAFAMGFGWAGLLALRGTEWPMPGVIGAGVAGGTGMAWIMAVLLRAMHDLESSGNVSIRSALGGQGIVYATVPGAGEGRGRVTVVVQGRQFTYNAVTTGPALPTGTRVGVVAVNDDNTLTVARA